jgi:thiol-disulfide isomerase/thioredoxin
MNKILGLLLLLISTTATIGQHKIEFDIKNYDQDTVVIGYYLIDKQLVYDTLYPNEDNKYVLEGEENLDPGVYMLLTVPEREFIQFLVSETEQNYKVSFSADQLGKLEFENAPDNRQLNDYVDFLKEVRPRADILRDTIAKLTEANKNVTKFQEELSAIDKRVMDYQEKVYSQHPEYISSQMLKANKEIVVPDFSDAADPNLARYQYYREHYFDNINLDNPASLRTPYLHQRVDYYINKLTPNHPDSISIALDNILEQMEPAPETFKFYLSHFLNEYAASKIVGYDAIYVHLVDKYYADGKATWVEQDNLDKIIKRANDIRPTLIGKIGADLTVYDQDETPITLSEIDYEYLILLFWAPDCGHCKKSMPDYVKFNEKWNSKGVKTLAICTKHQDKTKTCWDAVEDKSMGGFINAADEYHRSKFKIKYNVTSTPKLFILDKNREIIMKNIGSDQLDLVMEEIIKMKKMEEEGN